MTPPRAVVVALLCCMAACSRPRTEVAPAKIDGEASSSSTPSPVPPASTIPIETSPATPDAGNDCRKLPLALGGTMASQSFEGRIALVSGHDPEQGDGTFPVLVLDVPVCGTYALAPQQELLVGVLGGKAKWAALGRQWSGQRVRVTGEVRSMDIYLRPLRHFLLFASRVEARP